ncbi:N-acetyl sugar amidotransferase [Kiloniella litopenaei]|uniref:N-acetyl sugar amidotransferase n=1 Tax=Kiloniella litopenaei TaxID=1549748 RepID=UPI003BAD9427
MSFHERHLNPPEFCYCAKCATPITRPRLRLDAKQICNGCNRSSKKKDDIDWDLRAKEFKKDVWSVINKQPDREYDVVVPISGGKDSTFQAWYAAEKLGCRVLGVNIQPFLPTDSGLDNLRNIAENLPVDVISVIPNQDLYARISRLGLEQYGDPYLPWFYTVWGYTTRIAIQKKIPVMLFGENGETEYAGSDEPEWTELDHKGVETRIKSDKRDFKGPEQWTDFGFSEEELKMFIQPDDEEMAEVGMKRFFFSDYIPWNNNYHLHVALNVVGGFKTSQQRSTGTYTYGYSIDDDLYDVYLWFTWPKFGYGRAAKYASKDIQEGKMTREQAIDMVKEYDGEFPWEAVDRYLEKTNMSYDQFWDSVAKFVGDEENLRKEAIASGEPMKIPAWEKIGERKWRLKETLHGEERILELPMKRPNFPVV